MDDLRRRVPQTTRESWQRCGRGTKRHSPVQGIQVRYCVQCLPHCSIPAGGSVRSARHDGPAAAALAADGVLQEFQWISKSVRIQTLCVWQQRLSVAAVHRQCRAGGERKTKLVGPRAVRDSDPLVAISPAENRDRIRGRLPEGEVGHDCHCAGGGQADAAIGFCAGGFRLLAHRKAEWNGRPQFFRQRRGLDSGQQPAPVFFLPRRIFH